MNYYHYHRSNSLLQSSVIRRSNTLSANVGEPRLCHRRENSQKSFFTPMNDINQSSDCLDEVDSLKAQVFSPEDPILPKYEIHSSTQRNDYHLQNRVNPALSYSEKKSKRKKILVLDLDETLVHSSFKPFNVRADLEINVVFDGVYHKVYVLKRPNVNEFLKKMDELFEVYVFTASISQYADPVLDQLDIHNVVKKRLFRESCIYRNGSYVKDLAVIQSDLRDVILLDNNPISYSVNLSNGVPILTWHDDRSDRELTRILPLMEYLAVVDDVRYVINKTIFDEHINYALLEKMIATYKNEANQNNNNFTTINHTQSLKVKNSFQLNRDEKDRDIQINSYYHYNSGRSNYKTDERKEEDDTAWIKVKPKNTFSNVINKEMTPQKMVNQRKESFAPKTEQIKAVTFFNEVTMQKANDIKKTLKYDIQPSKSDNEQVKFLALNQFNLDKKEQKEEDSFYRTYGVNTNNQTDNSSPQKSNKNPLRRIYNSPSPKKYSRVNDENDNLCNKEMNDDRSTNPLMHSASCFYQPKSKYPNEISKDQSTLSFLRTDNCLNELDSACKKVQRTAEEMLYKKKHASLSNAQEILTSITPHSFLKKDNDERESLYCKSAKLAELESSLNNYSNWNQNDTKKSIDSSYTKIQSFHTLKKKLMQASTRKENSKLAPSNHFERDYDEPTVRKFNSRKNAYDTSIKSEHSFLAGNTSKTNMLRNTMKNSKHSDINKYDLNSSMKMTKEKTRMALQWK